jgi:hypothetical protein
MLNSTFLMVVLSLLKKLKNRLVEPDKISRFSNNKLEIKEEDIIYVHRKTVGITKILFQFETMHLQFFDTGFSI